MQKCVFAEGKSIYSPLFDINIWDILRNMLGSLPQISTVNYSIKIQKFDSGSPSRALCHSQYQTLLQRYSES